MSDFDAFWQAYPKKVAKGLARAAFAKAISKTTLDTMLRALTWQVRSEDWLRGFIPHPATWLAQERWDDEPMPPRLSAKSARAMVAIFGDAFEF